MNTQLLDDFSPIELFVVFAIVTFACYEIGFRIGRWWQDRMPGEQEGPTDMLVGSILALMAFLLAVTMGMASDRFDVRRGNVLADANAIGSVYLQADYLPEPAATQLKELVREYIPLRIVTDPATVPASMKRSVELHGQMWGILAEAIRSGNAPSDLTSALGDSMSELVAINESRLSAGIYARVPETVLLLLFVGSILSLAMVGYMAGLKKQRSILSAVVMVVALGVVLAIVVDIDRPTEGLINVSQQPLLDVQKWVGTPAP
jgi:hypothetical protein